MHKFTKKRKFWVCHTVTAFDCPHLTKEWIDTQIEMYGENSPLIRSMIYGEFVDDSGEGLVLNQKSLEECLQNPPELQMGMRVAFIDFAAGGDECVFALRNGNKVVEMVTWREKNTNVTIGKILNLIKKFSDGWHSIKREYKIWIFCLDRDLDIFDQMKKVK